MESKHIIVHLIRGEAKTAHEAITRDLVEQLDAFPIHDRIVPHLTLKRWFELDETGVGEVCKVLDEFADTHVQSDYHLHGFDNFTEDVIYVDVEPSPAMSQSARDLMLALHRIKDMTFDEYDDVDNHFHATVVMRALKPFDFKQTWDYLLTQKALDFNMKFDNVSLLRRDTDKWVAERVWELRAV